MDNKGKKMTKKEEVNEIISYVKQCIFDHIEKYKKQSGSIGDLEYKYINESYSKIHMMAFDNLKKEMEKNKDGFSLYVSDYCIKLVIPVSRLHEDPQKPGCCFINKNIVSNDKFYGGTFEQVAAMYNNAGNAGANNGQINPDTQITVNNLNFTTVDEYKTLFGVYNDHFLAISNKMKELDKERKSCVDIMKHLHAKINSF